jgi:hypothetical protein
VVVGPGNLAREEWMEIQPVKARAALWRMPRISRSTNKHAEDMSSINRRILSPGNKRQSEKVRYAFLH